MNSNVNLNEIDWNTFNIEPFVPDLVKGRTSPLLQAIGVLAEETLNEPKLENPVDLPKSITQEAPKKIDPKVWTYYIDHQPTKNELYKTEACRSLKVQEACAYGKKCRFYHSEEERRPKPVVRKYKTVECATFRAKGICGYGERCNFIHKKETK